MKTVYGLIGATGVIWLSNYFGLWQASILIGAVLGIVYGAKRASWLGLLSGIIGWALPLVVASISGAAILPMAKLIGEILGLAGGLSTVIGLALPALVGGLLTLSGGWIAGAVKGVIVVSRQTAQTTKPQPTAQAKGLGM